MNFGIRMLSLRKLISARTTKRINCAVKKVIIPEYEKKDTDVIKASKRAIYNKVYRKITSSIFDIIK